MKKNTMALVQIVEPNTPVDKSQPRLAVGIDLGTTNSLVASVRNGVPVPLADTQGRFALASAVRYLKDNTVSVGRDAKQCASCDPYNCILSVKRLIGRGLEDVQQLGEQLPYRFQDGDSQMPLIETVQGCKSPVEVSAEILKVLRQRGEQALGGDLFGAVITVPAYFDDAQRQATKDAARLAGINVLRLLNEPTAAAVAYGLDQQAEGVIVVYDLGGGTFDVSILRLTRGVFEVLATGGDSALGGDDFDHAIANWIVQQAGVSSDLEPGEQRRLMRLACDVKEALSSAESTPVQYKAWQAELGRADFEQLITPLVARSLKACRRALRDSDVELEEIAAVVMVGGSTRVPYVREQVAHMFAREPLADIDPDKVVALGAALQADVLAGNQADSDNLLLLDVIPLSLGLETMGDLVEKIVPRNTTIPVTRTQDFTTARDGQTAIALHIVQGERELASASRSLARFELRGIPPMVAGAAKVRVSFQVDADGLLSVTATETRSGVEARVEIKPSYGLSEDAVSRMLEESIENAEHDRKARGLREQQVNAQRLLETVRAALQSDGNLLNEQERALIDEQLEKLEQAQQGDEIGAIARQIQQLNAATHEFASRRMDATVKRAFAGRQLEEV